eukprot:COSAG06_NODE_1011_length_11045_cov_6.246723_7_plen_72_part_00
MGCVCTSVSAGADGAAVRRRVPHSAASHDSRDCGVTAAPGATGRGGNARPLYIADLIAECRLTEHAQKIVS